MTACISCVKRMNTLMVFDSSVFIKHLTTEDSSTLVDFIVKSYGPAMQNAIRYFEGDLETLMRQYYDELYLSAVLSEDFDKLSLLNRVIDDEGVITNKRARYNELVEIIISTFNGEIGAVLRAIQLQAKKIYTVRTLGYENRCLKLLLNTDE